MEQEVSLLKKIHVIYSFFFVRRVVAPIVTFAFYCIVIPVSVVVPEVSIPIWGVVYIPTTITVLNAIRNPRYQSLLMNIPLDQNFLPWYALSSSQLPSHNAILDFVWERHVHAPDESSLDRSTWDSKRKWMGCDTEAWRHPEREDGNQCCRIHKNKLHKR